jgi:hypothetical protein
MGKMGFNGSGDESKGVAMLKANPLTLLLSQ